jgi:hypothetical protein
MADLNTTTRRRDPSARLSALDRLAPRPDSDRVAAEIAARTAPGDVVLELHGRGAWVARGAIDDVRRAFAIEGAALTRLVAELVLRPPDLRHLDAAVSAIAVDARGSDGGLRHAIEATYASTCSNCDGPVVVDEFIWEADATDPARKSYTCKRCGNGQGEAKPVEVDADDVYRSRAIDSDRARIELEGRFPAPGGDLALPQAVVDLFPPRAQSFLWSLLDRIENESRAPSITAALRLALVQMAPHVSRLNGYPGRVSQLRIAEARIRPPASKRWRERNAWTEFEAATRAVRNFVASLEAHERAPARAGADLRALVDGVANVALRFGTPEGPETFGPPPRSDVEPGARPRIAPAISLVLSQPPIHWSPENTAFAYLATSLALGPDAARTLPLDTIFRAKPRSGWARDTATLQRALTAVAPVMLPNAEVVLLHDEASAEQLTSTVIGAVGAGLRADDAILDDADEGLSGTVRFTDPRTRRAGERDVAIRSVSDAGSPFQITAVEAAITDIAVAVIQLRGEPTRFGRILGEVLLGLDQLGHLRRLVGVRGSTVDAAPKAKGERASGLWGELPTEAAGEEPSEGVDGSEGRSDSVSSRPPPASESEAVAPGPASDPVRLTLDIIHKEMGRNDHPRLVESEEGVWWLRDPADIKAVKPALSERVEWGIFSLLSTSAGITETSFRERIARLYRGPETADRELVDACLESYRLPQGDDDRIHTDESLERRYSEHGEIVGTLTDFGHRLGMRAWIARREQRRLYAGAPLADLLSDPEQRAYLPLIAPGPQEVLEEVDCIWYVRGRGAFLFDVEWMAALDEPIRQRGVQIGNTDALVRFIVIPDERVPLVRLRLARSPLLRERMEKDNWHILKWSHVLRLRDSKRADLSVLSPLIGLDPAIESDPDQMGLFE